MLKCKQASQLISQGLDKKLSGRERFGLKMHLLMCRYCRRFSQQLHKLNVVISSMKKNIENDEDIKLSPEAKDRIVKSIESRH